MEILSMSKREIEQISVFENLKNKSIKQKHAAKLLNLSVRQIQRKLKKYRELGTKGLIHSNRGKPSNRKLNLHLVDQALKLIEERYPDFGPTFAAEKLYEIHNIKINHETLRLRMIKEGLWKAKKRKQKHREWRERKECLGEFIQLDGSDHDWFEKRFKRCTLLAFIDDATSRILHLEFAKESTVEVMKSTKKYILKYGLPNELYVDRGKVFKVNLNNPDNDKLTQYQRAMSELSVEITHARSPQAKGRVERLFGTLQDRLVKELRLKDISTIKEANNFIENEYLPKHNQKYQVPAKSNTNLHREANNYNLDNILCIKEKRILTNDFTIRYKNRWFQLEKKQRTILFPKDEIIVVTHLDKKTELKIRNTNLFFHKIDKPAVKGLVKTSIQKEKKPWKPPANHPWKRFNIKRQKDDISKLQKSDISILV